MDYFIWRIHKTTSMESKVNIYNQRHELRCGLTSSNSQEYSMHYGLYYVQTNIKLRPNNSSSYQIWGVQQRQKIIIINKIHIFKYLYSNR